MDELKHIRNRAALVDFPRLAPFAPELEHDWLVVFYNVAQSISRELDLEKLLWLIMDEVRKALRADRCTVFLLDEEKDELWALAAHGAKEIRFPAHLGIAGYVAKTGHVLNIPEAYDDPRFNREIDRKTGYRTKSILTAPLRNHVGEIIGVFQVLNKVTGPFTSDDELLLNAISGIAATQIENAQLYAEQKRTFESTIETVASTIDARDPMTAGHSKRVAMFCEEMANVLGLSGEEREKLRIAALLHDCGKIAWDDDILRRTGRLSAGQLSVVRSHPARTRRILEQIHFPKHLRDIPLIASSHHERLDGSGYPLGLKGEEISPLARILAIADVFEAMTSKRTYRGRIGIQDVLAELRRGSHRLYDALYVEALGKITVLRFLEIVNDGGAGAVKVADRFVLGRISLNDLGTTLTSTDSRSEMELFNRYYCPDPKTGKEDGQTIDRPDLPSPSSDWSI